ncbi:MAG TPA: hypothetical protein VIO14_02050 [Dehalococcoidia bacterium]
MGRIVPAQTFQRSRRLDRRGGAVLPVLTSPLARRAVLALALLMLLRAALPAVTCAAHPATAVASHHTPADLLGLAHDHQGDHATHHHGAGTDHHHGAGHCEITSDDGFNPAVLVQPDLFLLAAGILLTWPAFTVALAAARVLRPASVPLAVLPRPPSAV